MSEADSREDEFIPVASTLVPLPEDMRTRFVRPRERFAGAFGEAWSAYDLETQRPVILKMFYNTDESGQRYHLSWGHAASHPELAKQLNASAAECTVARKLQLYAMSDPTGASRFMQCYEDHVTCPECVAGQSSGMSTTGHTVLRSQALYLVLEECEGDGGLPLSDWMNSTVSAPDYAARVVTIFKEMMEGLAYLTRPQHAVKWVHHDLKPDNVVVKVKDGVEYAKIIDFGCTVEAKPEYALELRLPATWKYAPPEWVTRAHLEFDVDSPWSWDTYAAASILSEMLTGEMLYDKLHARGMKATCQEARRRQRRRRRLKLTEFEKTRRKVEPALTSAWIADPSSPDARKTLYGPGFYSPSFAKVVQAFLAKAKRYGFWDVHLKMLAPIPAERATPSEVLETEFMKMHSSPPDPDFEASAAQKSAEEAFKAAK